MRKKIKHVKIFTLFFSILENIFFYNFFHVSASYMEIEGREKPFIKPFLFGPSNSMFLHRY